ncbi:MAG: hypothetical protein ACI9MB_002704, partial [Verrucomicrobiales bacterium]
TFIVELINPSEGFAILNGTCLVTIQDDDSMALLAKSVSVSSNASSDDITIEWEAIPERPYSIFSSTDLLNWEPVTGGQGITTTTSEGKYTFTPEPGDRRFYRMTDTLPE